MALPMCAMPCVSVLIPQKYHNWMEVPTKLCLQVTQSELPLSVFHPRPFLLGASGCVSLWPHLPRKTPRNLSSTVAHMMQPLCKLSTTTNRSFYEKTSRLALMVVPVPLPVHSTRASSWVCEYVCVCVQTCILFIQPGYCCLLWELEQITLSVLTLLFLPRFFPFISLWLILSQGEKISCGQTFSNPSVFIKTALISGHSSVNHIHQKLLGWPATGVIHLWKEAFVFMQKTIAPTWQQDFLNQTQHIQWVIWQQSKSQQINTRQRTRLTRANILYSQHRMNNGAPDRQTGCHTKSFRA